jgi:hypothetical protein
LTLRQFVKKLRNAVAHFKLTPTSEHGVVTAFVFSDRNGFKTEIPVSDLRQFIYTLAQTLTDPVNSDCNHAP